MNAMPPREQPVLQPTDLLTVTLEAQDWNVVFEGLTELRMKVARPVFDKIMVQIQRAPAVGERVDATD